MRIVLSSNGTGYDVNFTYWDYGSIYDNSGNKKERTIPADEFLKGMKGYWIPEKKPAQ